MPGRMAWSTGKARRQLATVARVLDSAVSFTNHSYLNTQKIRLKLGVSVVAGGWGSGYTLLQLSLLQQPLYQATRTG
jgi:hypothetical protein